MFQNLQAESEVSKGHRQTHVDFLDYDSADMHWLYHLPSGYVKIAIENDH